MEANNFKPYMMSAMKQIQAMNYTDIDDVLYRDAMLRIKGKKYLKYALYYENTQCQNRKCGKKYLKHKFGVDSLPISKKASVHKSLECIRKFYVCKGCKLTFYCSRRCQKIDWNMYGHKQFCNRVKKTLRV